MKKKKLWRRVTMSPELEEQFKDASIEAKIKASKKFKNWGRQLQVCANIELTDAGPKPKKDPLRNIGEVRRQKN
jgi:hypothetical protein